jgi:rhodanese-related sulfurtransferase
MAWKPNEVKRMSMTKEVVRHTMKDKYFVVVNVLPEEEYAKLHIKGSENIPLGSDVEAFVRAAEKKYGKRRFLITYCADGACGTAFTAAQLLLRNGFQANDYSGGMKEWSDAGYPIEGTETDIKQVFGEPIRASDG